MLGSRITPRTARALVTGAGSGIGACYAKHLAGLGYNLVLVARDRRKLDDVAEGIRREHGVEVEVLPRDLSTPAGVDDLVERVTREPIEIVVNSAGMGLWGRVVELDDDRLRAEVDTNVVAVHRITIAAARAMQSRGRGAVVNVASLSAVVPMPYLSTYCATKAFLLSFSEGLHEELRGTGVIVQALCPGFTRTAMFATSGADESKIPACVWMKADTVVRASLSALRWRRAICIPGWRYHIAYFVTLRTPRWISRRIMGMVFSRFNQFRLRKPEPTPVAATNSATPARLVETKQGESSPSGDAHSIVQPIPLEAVT